MYVYFECPLSPSRDVEVKANILDSQQPFQRTQKMDPCSLLTFFLCAALSDSVRGNGSPSKVLSRVSDIGLHRLELSDCETKPCTSGLAVAVTAEAIFLHVTTSSGSAMQLQFSRNNGKYRSKAKSLNHGNHMSDGRPYCFPIVFRHKHTPSACRQRHIHIVNGVHAQ
jgi:hypothetical protein